MSTPFKLKGHTLPGPNQAAPLKQTPSFNLKGYFKGEQGFVPDYKGQSTKENINSIFETKEYPGGYSKQKKYQERGQSKSSKSKRKTQ
jgi:hypothetical protein